MAIYVSKIVKGPATFFMLRDDGSVYALKMELDFDDTASMNYIEPLTQEMTYFPILKLLVAVPENPAARDELCSDAWASISSIEGQIGEASKSWVRQMERETEYHVFDDDE